MLSDDQLGEILRAELREITEDIQPSPEFKARMLPEKRPRFRLENPLRVVASAAVALAAVVAGVLFVFSGSNPASALLVKGQNIYITPRELANLPQLNREFERLHFRIRAVPMTATCRTRQSANLLLSYMGVSSKTDIEITRTVVPAGETSIIASGKPGARVTTQAIGIAKGAIPSCVSSHGVGPGLPGWHLTPKDRLPTKTPP